MSTSLFSQNDWENFRLFEISKEAAHTRFLPIDERNPEINVDKKSSPYNRLSNCKSQLNDGLGISGLLRIDTSAMPFSLVDLEAATHNDQLPERAFYSIQVDYKQRGVGGNNSWGLKPLNKYRLLADNYNYSSIISPV